MGFLLPLTPDRPCRVLAFASFAPAIITYFGYSAFRLCGQDRHAKNCLSAKIELYLATQLRAFQSHLTCVLSLSRCSPVKYCVIHVMRLFQIRSVHWIYPAFFVPKLTSSHLPDISFFSVSSFSSTSAVGFLLFLIVVVLVDWLFRYVLFYCFAFPAFVRD